MNRGWLVLSLSGRDKGRLFVVTEVIDESYVYIADGKLRRLNKPKRKKIKHLKKTGELTEIPKSDKALYREIKDFSQS